MEILPTIDCRLIITQIQACVKHIDNKADRMHNMVDS